MLGVWGLAVIACVLGLAAPPGTHEGLAGRGLDVLHVLGTAALAVTLVLGPGIVLRARPRLRRLELGFLPLPGLGLLAATACVAWVLADHVAAWLVCLLILTPILVWMPVSLLRGSPRELLEREERFALLVVGCVFGLAIARALWSLGPLWELYGGTISRTLEVGGRSDSRIPFAVVQLVAHGTAPFSALAASYFSPFDFSSRGPLAGLASAPIVLAAGGRPPVELPNQPWTPFDPQGFMAFRIAAMAFASTAFLSLWTLIRTLGGPRAARFGLLLAATTPFLVHEVWFTWPKLFAASFVLLAAICVIKRYPLRAGLLGGTGYLAHPGALLYVPVLCLMALWPLTGARLRRPQLRQLVLVLAGAAICVVGWRVINGSHYTQSGFLDYLTQAGWGEAADARQLGLRETRVRSQHRSSAGTFLSHGQPGLGHRPWRQPRRDLLLHAVLDRASLWHRDCLLPPSTARFVARRQVVAVARLRGDRRAVHRVCDLLAVPGRNAPREPPCMGPCADRSRRAPATRRRIPLVALRADTRPSQRASARGFGCCCSADDRKQPPGHLPGVRIDRQPGAHRDRRVLRRSGRPRLATASALRRGGARIGPALGSARRRGLACPRRRRLHPILEPRHDISCSTTGRISSSEPT